MMDELICLLNAAGSDNLQLSVSAGQQIVHLTSCTDDSISRQFFGRLAATVLDPANADLAPNGRLLGMIHLKNLLYDRKVWSGLSIDERKQMRHMLFHYIRVGLDADGRLNVAERDTGSGSCIVTLFSCFVKHEWTKPDWCDTFWNQLIEFCAWHSLRFSLRAAASFRSPYRRTLFLRTIRTLLSTIYDIWCSTLSEIRYSHEAGYLLSKLLYTCLTASGNGPITDVYILDGDLSCFAKSICDQSFSTLVKLFSLDSITFSSFKLARRLTKLILASLIASSPSVRGEFIWDLCSHILQYLTFCSSTSHGSNNHKSVLWCLATMYGLIRAPCSDLYRKISLDDAGLEKFTRWLFRDVDNGSSTNLGRLLYTVIPVWGMLSNAEVDVLLSDPESCLTAGGSSQYTAVSDTPSSPVNQNIKGDVESCTVNALSIWDTDEYIRELSCMSLTSVLGLDDSTPFYSSVQACRQLVELILFALFQHYKSITEPIVFNLFENMLDSGSIEPLRLECLLRMYQICLPYIDSSACDWSKLTEKLLAISLSTCNPNITKEYMVLQGRLLTFKSRLTYYLECSFKQVSSDAVRLQYDRILVQLIQTMQQRLITSSDQPIVTSNTVNYLRLNAAACLDWLLRLSSFPSEVCRGHMNDLFNEIFNLIRDVSECETRVYLLQILHHLIESSDPSEFTQLINTTINFFGELWNFEPHSSALRGNIMNAICMLQTALNASHEDSLTLRQNLQTPVSILIRAAVTASSTRNDPSGAEAMFDPALRLWVSLVTGPGAIWSPAVEQLFVLLVGPRPLPSENGSIDKTVVPVLDRLETLEHVQQFFAIVEGYLFLVCTFVYGDATKNYCNSLDDDFFAIWTDHFFGVVTNFSTDRDSSIFRESEFTLRQLNLAITWFSICFDHVGHCINLSAAVVDLFTSAARQSLLQAPFSEHDDSCVQFTSLNLSLIALLAISPNMWTKFLLILHYVLTNGEQSNQCLSDSLQSSSVEYNQVACGHDWIALIRMPLSRWLTRADSLNDAMHRRLFAVASVIALRFGGKHLSCQSSNPNLITDDKWYMNWATPVINLCIQVLCESDDCYTSCDSSTLRNLYPRQLRTKSGLRARILDEFTRCDRSFDGPPMTDSFLRCYVDPALLEQINREFVFS